MKSDECPIHDGDIFKPQDDEDTPELEGRINLQGTIVASTRVTSFKGVLHACANTYVDAVSSLHKLRRAVRKRLGLCLPFQ